MTVYAVPSSVFPGGGLQPELCLGTGALLPSEAITAVLSRRHRCGVSLVINPNKHATSTNQAGTTSAKPPCWLTQSSTSARHRSVRLDVELKVELSKTTSMVF